MTAEAALFPGMGKSIRTEFLWRAIAAAVFAIPYLAMAVYGLTGVTAAIALGVPFLVFGSAGFLAQLAAAVALLSARTAITGDRYNRSTAARARRFVAAVLVAVLAGAVTAVIARSAAPDVRLADITATGLVTVLLTTADHWRAMLRLR